jgi:uncharacterized protein (TIGR03083 family)
VTIGAYPRRVDFPSHLEHIEEQASALRAAAVSAGPAATVPTCPEWTVHRLVRHIARVHDWVGHALATAPDAEPAPAETPPDEWDALLPWWDDTLEAMLTALRAGGEGAPAWVFPNAVAATAAFWARRQAHETAIHRLDAEHARAGSDRPTAVASLVFQPDLAADGIDELLVLMIPRKLARDRPSVGGTVLFHAADAGRAWLVTLKPGEVPEIGPAGDTDADASVVGTADAVYRAGWRRPSTAIVTGDRALVEALRTP